MIIVISLFPQSNTVEQDVREAYAYFFPGQECLSDITFPLTDIQADFEINWSFRYRNTAKINYFHRRQTDGQTDRLTDYMHVAYDNNG